MTAASDYSHEVLSSFSCKMLIFKWHFTSEIKIFLSEVKKFLSEIEKNLSEIKISLGVSGFSLAQVVMIMADVERRKVKPHLA